MRNIPTDGFDFKRRSEPVDPNVLFANEVEGCPDEERLLVTGEPVELTEKALAEFTAWFQARVNKVKTPMCLYSEVIRLGVLMDGKYPLRKSRAEAPDLDEDDGDDSLTLDRWAGTDESFMDYDYYLDEERRWGAGQERERRESADMEDMCTIPDEDARTDRRAFADGSAVAARRNARALQQEKSKSKVK